MHYHDNQIMISNRDDSLTTKLMNRATDLYLGSNESSVKALYNVLANLHFKLRGEISYRSTLLMRLNREILYETLVRGCVYQSVSLIVYWSVHP